MALPVVIPNTFATATASIPLSQLDSNFNTLSNVINEINAGTQQLSNANVAVLIVNAGTSAAPSITTTGDTNTGIFFPAADTIAFAEGGAEAMRIDSSGQVGISNTSPNSYQSVARQLVVGSTGSNGITIGSGTTGTGNIFFADGTTGADGYQGSVLYDHSSNHLAFGTTALERMRIDSSGNVGIGVTPSAWQTTQGSRAIQFLGSSLYGYRDTDLLISTNAYYDGAWKYYASSIASSYYQLGNGSHIWYTAPSGTANNAITWTERARITSGGYFKASDNGAYTNTAGAYHEAYQSANDYSWIVNNGNASFTVSNILNRANRSASSAYQFFVAESANGGDTEFILRGDGNAYADGTWNNNGADYAEFFESANGQALTLGATVVLDGNKVREATDQDPATSIIGVVRPKEPSKASMVVGNTAWNKWANKYLTDDFDRYIMEDHDVVEWEEQVLEREAVAAVEAVVDEEGVEIEPAVPAQEAVYKTVSHSYESHNIPAGVTVPADATRKTHDEKGNKFQHYKLNPAWDKDAEYVNRENRPEWNIIGLLGQVKILKGQPVGDRWIKMRDVSATVEEWMIR